MTDTVDYNVPFIYINTNKWDEEKSHFQFDINPNFVKDASSRFKTKELEKQRSQMEQKTQPFKNIWQGRFRKITI